MGDEVVCHECHIVTQVTILDYGPEWRAFDQQETRARARTGPPVTVAQHDDGLTTRIPIETRDVHGQQLSPSQRRRLRRLKRSNKWYVRTTDSERSLCDGLKQIRKVAADVGIPDSVIHRAQQLFRDAVYDDFLKRYDIDRTVAATTYAACRLQGVTITITELAVATGLEGEQVECTYRTLCRELSLEPAPQSGQEYVPRICTELDLGHGVERDATELIEKLREVKPGIGLYPTTLAAVAVYTVCRHTSEHPTVTQLAVGEVADINNSTISTAYADLRELFESLQIS